ncbi:MAG: DnaD domain protein [Clostridia bacterium]|nr:DnaD domain protein [Clostridia bacterium]
MLFGFDEGYALFDVTPVDNQFIQEYLPSARGDDVRVYLYGLMRCYHPDEEINTEKIGKELNISAEDVEKAYRYWERRGLVKKVSDDPVGYRYVSLKRNRVSGGEQVIDPEYETFTESLYEVFGNSRRLHGGEIETCYEWVEDLGLSPEAVIMLLKHMEKKRGRNFTIQSAEPVAAQMAKEGAKTVEEAEAFLSRDQALYQGTRAVLKRLGKRNAPSEDQVSMYRKWTQDWGFTPEAIEAACAETAGGDPSMGYLDAILRNLRENAGHGKPMDAAGVKAAREEGEQLKKVLRAAGAGARDDDKLAWYRGLRKDFPEDMILLAARECRGRPLEDTGSMLRSWQSRGIVTAEEATAYIREFRAQSDLMRKLRDLWGLSAGLGGADRTLITAWEKKWGFTPEQILYAAEAAAGTEKPMAYLNRILEGYAEQGIRTREAMEADRKEHQERKPKPDQNSGPKALSRGRIPAGEAFEQRDYGIPRETLDEVLDRMEGGTQSDA